MTKQISLLILFDKEKRILLQHHSNDAKRMPGYWGFFGGHMEKGETPEQTLLRESEEELEYVPKKPTLIMVQRYVLENKKRIKYVYIEKFDKKVKLVQYEGQAMGWYHLNETINLKMIDHDREIIEYIKNKY